MLIISAAGLVVIGVLGAILRQPHASFKQGNFLVELERGSSKLPETVEINLNMNNLPSANFGTIALRGDNIIDASGKEHNWEGDHCSAQISHRSASIRFWQKHLTSNFKVFQSASWQEVVTNADFRWGNIKFDLSKVARVGDRVRITYDGHGSDTPKTISFTSGDFTVSRLPGVASSKPDFVEVELAVRDLDPAEVENGVSVRGTDIINNFGTGQNWNGDDVSSAIENNAATLTFWQNRPITDFKVFGFGNNREMLSDKTARDGNIRLNLGLVAKPGDKVRITVNARPH